MLKSIARLAGLASPDRCILVFPRSLDELDRKSAEFCPEDHDALVAAGILKGNEADTGDCIAISDRRPVFPYIVARRRISKRSRMSEAKSGVFPVFTRITEGGGLRRSPPSGPDPSA